MTTTIRESDTEADSAAAVLGSVRDRRAVADRAEADLLQLAVSWVAMHSVDSIDDAATVWDRTYGDTGITVAGPGAPLVAEFSVAEFAAAVGLASEAGKAYLGEAVELRYRLRRVWARVTRGDLVAWKARRIAHATSMLTMEAATFVDRHVAPVAHRVRVSQLDRLIEEAIARFMPEETERRRQAAADGRSFNIQTNQTSLNGTADVWGTLDVADAFDLDAAVTAGAQATWLDRVARRAPRPGCWCPGAAPVELRPQHRRRHLHRHRRDTEAASGRGARPPLRGGDRAL